MSPANGQGLDCDRTQPGCAAPTNVEVAISFDRPLLPASAVRQSLSIFINEKATYMPFFEPEYDLLSRRVIFRAGATFLPGVLYQVRMPIAKSASDSGFRAFDGAPLEDGAVRTRSSFFTADAPIERPPRPPFEEPTCAQVLQLFEQSCVSSCCHGKDAPAMGLALDSAESLAESAVSRIAHQTETGNTVGVHVANPARFGVAMLRIDPGKTYASYLMYKLLLEPRNLQPCAENSPFCALPGASRCAPLSESESERLSERFVQGVGMPPSSSAARLMGCDDLPPRAHLDCGELRAISRWIDGGATCP